MPSRQPSRCSCIVAQQPLQYLGDHLSGDFPALSRTRPAFFGALSLDLGEEAS